MAARMKAVCPSLGKQVKTVFDRIELHLSANPRGKPKFSETLSKLITYFHNEKSPAPSVHQPAAQHAATMDIEFLIK